MSRTVKKKTNYLLKNTIDCFVSKFFRVIKMRDFLIFLFLGAVFLLSISTDVYAVNKTWDNNGGGGDGNWNTAVNWDPDGIPQNADDVIFDNTSDNACSVNTSPTVTSISLNAGYDGVVTQAADQNVTVTGNFTVSSGTWAIGVNDLSVGGNSNVTGGEVTIGASGTGDDWSTVDMTIGAGGTVTCSGASLITVSGNWDASNGTFTYDVSTVDLTGTGNLVCSALGGGGAHFYNLNAAAVGQTTTTTGGMTVHNVLTLGTGTLTCSAGYSEFWLQKNGGSPLVTGGATISPTFLVYGPTWAVIEGTTVAPTTYDCILAISPFGSVTIDAGGDIVADDLYIYGQNPDATATFDTKGFQITVNGDTVIGDPWTVPTGRYGTLECNGSTFDFNGSLTIQESDGDGTNSIDADASTLRVSGNFTNNDIFTCDTSNVVFDGAGRSVIAGSTTFYDLSCTTAGKLLSFTAGTTQTVNNTLTLTGTAASRINLQSTTGGSKWDMTFPNGAQTVSYVVVKDSDANTNTVTCYNSISQGNNNANWVFNNAEVDVPVAGSTITSTSTIIGTVDPGAVVTVRGTVGGAAFTQVAQVTADANGNYRITQSDYTNGLDVGANNVRIDVGAVQGTAVNVTVSASPTANQVPTITSHTPGSRLKGNKPTISGRGTPGATVTLTANDNNGNLLLTDVATTTVDANGNWVITWSDYTTALVSGTNNLSVTIGGVASNVIGVSLVDPFGIVFDSVTNNPISSATVTIFNANGTRCTPGVEIAATDANPQTTGADGFYNFLCANGNYYITVTANGYEYPSAKTSFPAGRTIVTGSRGENFTVAGVIIEMDHPMDSTNLLLNIRKQANKKEIVIGEVVTYTVTIKNIVNADITGVYLEDAIPAGFKYVSDRATLDGVPINPAGQNPIVFNIGTLSSGRTRTLKYQLVAGSGVTQGNYENTAWARYADAAIISNRASATVKIALDPLFDLGTIIGKVFRDINENGRQDRLQKAEGNIQEREAGIAGVQIVMEDGVVVTTDEGGKYHIPAVIPGRHILRVDEASLPQDSYLTTEKAVIVDVTPGILARLNFGVNFGDKRQKSPVNINQRREKPEPRLNVSLWPSAVCSSQFAREDKLSVADSGQQANYEFEIFTNYTLFIDRWELQILDRDTKALVKSFEGGQLTLNEPIYWDGKDENGRWLNPERDYVYVLTVADKDGRQDRTIKKELPVKTESETQSLKKQDEIRSEETKREKRHKWLEKESRINSLKIQNIEVEGEVVAIGGKSNFETEFKESTTSIMIDDIEMPVSITDRKNAEFTGEIIVPEGEHEIIVKFIDEDGKEQEQIKRINVRDEYLFFVAMGDVKTGYTFHGGHIEPIQHDDKFREGFWFEGKAAYYLKGKILGKYLVTSSLVTSREQKELFRDLDQHKYYPVYGDKADIDDDATATQGMLYVLIEWDASSLLWGDYHVEFKDTEFASFKRTLYGGKLHYETASTTQFGEPNTKLIIFKARAQQRAAHNEFMGTGGSLFYLKHKYIIEGSEKVTVEVRDKITGLVLAVLEQEEGFDYEIDYESGRLIFWQPVSYVAKSKSIVSTHLLDGNPLYVVVDYEYETKDKYDRGVYGARLEQSLADYLRLGGTYIKEEQLDKNYELKGVDTTVHLGRHVEITGEYAESESEEAGRFISTDGGLNFTELPTDDTSRGTAYGIKGMSTFFDKVSLDAYYKKIGRNFSSASTVSQAGKELIGAGLVYDLTDRTRLNIEHDVQRLIDDGNIQTQLQVGAKETETTVARIMHRVDLSNRTSGLWRGKLKLTGEYRHQAVEEPLEQFESETNTEADILAARADYKATDKVILSLAQQSTVSGPSNHQTTAGIKTRMNDYISFRAEETVGTKGAATSLGGSYNITDKLEIIGDYTQANYKTGDTEDRISVITRADIDEGGEIYHAYSVSKSDLEGREISSVFGSRKNLSENLELSLEEQAVTSEKERSNTNIFGLSGEINDKLGGTVSFERGMVQTHDGTQYKRSAPSLSLSYIDGHNFKSSVKLEARFDEGEEDKMQYFGFAAAEGRLNEDLTLFFEAGLSQSENRDTNSKEALYKKFTAGAAYRPLNFDRLNFLTKYDYLEDDFPAGQLDFKDFEKAKAHVVSGELAFDITDRWQLVEKIAFKNTEEKVSGFAFTKTQTWLMIHRLNYNINEDWQVGAEYRRLTQKQAEDSKQGALIEVSRDIGEFVQLGVGYNFTDFDDDLTSFNYTAHGPFLRLTGKYFDRSPEEIERFRKRAEEKKIKQWAWELVNHELARPHSGIAQQLYHDFYLGEKARELGRFEAAKGFYSKVIQAGGMMYQQALSFVKERVELEKQLKAYDSLARTYYKEGRWQEAKEIWQKIIREDIDVYSVWQ